MAIPKTIALFLALFFVASQAAPSCPKYNVQFFRKTAKYAAGLNSIVQKYKDALGGENNNNDPGPLKRGQRAINWDAGALPFDMPFDFFNTVATRGAIFSAKGNEFRVSNTNNASDIDDRFNSIIPNNVAQQFRRFSQQRLFTPLLNNFVTVSFRVPAKAQRASVVGFAAIFTDVDKWGATTMRFLDKRGCLITQLSVGVQDRGLSFAGIIVRNRWWKKVPAVAKVQVKLGTVSFAAFNKLPRWKKGNADLVPMDDLFYGEPQPIYY